MHITTLKPLDPGLFLESSRLDESSEGLISRAAMFSNALSASYKKIGTALQLDYPPTSFR